MPPSQGMLHFCKCSSNAHSFFSSFIMLLTRVAFPIGQAPEPCCWALVPIPCSGLGFWVPVQNLTGIPVVFSLVFWILIPSIIPSICHSSSLFQSNYVVHRYALELLPPSKALTLILASTRLRAEAKGLTKKIILQFGTGAH